MDMSTESIQGVVYSSPTDARAHGKGGIWYIWKIGSARKFPDDVASVFIVMPVNWGADLDVKQMGVACEWTINRPNPNGAQWSLSGKRDEPTLSPSLNWVGVWHGWLQDGYLKSC